MFYKGTRSQGCGSDLKAILKPFEDLKKKENSV